MEGAGRLSRAFAWLLLAVGLLLLSEVAVTLLWKEPLSALSAGGAQVSLSERLQRAEAEALARPARFGGGSGDGRAARLARRYGAGVKEGEPLGRIRIPRLGIDYVFVAGVTGEDLEKGPGHYGGTALPGERGTTGLAGHRTTHLAPFRRIDQLRRGDRVVVRMPYGRFTYAVEGSIVVSPRNTTPLRPVRHDRLALTTCTPLFSAAKRLIVTARLRATRLL